MVIAVGGLSVGEPRPAMREIAALTVAMLPSGSPRYLMGVGTPQDLLAGVAMGFDMFDCVLPTRNARNGSAFTSEGRLSIKRSEFARDERPLDRAAIAALVRPFRGPICAIFICQEKFWRLAH